MANFILTVDPDPERRNEYLDAVSARLAPVAGLTTSRVDSGSFGAAWAASERAPGDAVAGDGTAAVLWGHALRAGRDGAVDARHLADAWTTRDPAPPTFDGFFAGVSYAQGSGLVAGADVLGLFPVYYAAVGQVLLVGSSPELFRFHPLRPVAIDLQGLAGLLLTQGPFAGRTILDGVRRLAPAHALVWEPRGAHREVCQYTIAHPVGPPGGSFADHARILHEVHDETVARHTAPDTPVGLLLSGGRDSRLLGCYLAQHRNDVTALTLGIPSDHEVRCARGVARRLRFRHRIAAVHDDTFLHGARRQADWEHLASGFSSVHMWGAIEYLRDLPPSVVCGYLRETREIAPLPTSFDAYFAWDSRHAIPPDRLAGLVPAGPLRDALADTMTEIRAAFAASFPDDSQRAWRYFLSHYARTHAGAVPWRLSFASWPVLPVLDRALLDVTATVPLESMARRRAQDHIFVTRFPRVARIPLDRNTNNTTPVLPGLRHRMAQRWRGALERRGVPPGLRRVERRYYHRMFDFNRPGWRDIRRAAEPHRQALAAWFDLDALAAYLPPPEVDVRFDDQILDGFGPKLLTGLMLWRENHPA